MRKWRAKGGYQQKSPGAVVSDHAVVRWLQRVEGMDLEKVRAEAKIVTGEEPVTDQEFLDYLQTYHQLNVASIRQKIATDWVLSLIAAGVRYIPLHNRCVWLRVRDGVITTVVTRDHQRTA